MCPAHACGCAAALYDITAALCDVTAASVGCSVAEPQWAQSFWDGSAERTCCFQRSSVANMARAKARRARRPKASERSAASEAVGEARQRRVEEAAAMSQR